LVIDDPHKPLENPETAINYCRVSLFTRLNTPALGRILVIMQRLEPNDLSGVLIEGFDELPRQTDPEPATKVGVEEVKPKADYSGFEKLVIQDVIRPQSEMCRTNPLVLVESKGNRLPQKRNSHRDFSGWAVISVRASGDVRPATL
jgi:hypothetical protein